MKHKNVTSNFLLITEFAVESAIASDGTDDPGRWLSNIIGSAYIYSDHDQRVQVAKCKYVYADIEAASGEGIDPYYLLDTTSETAEFMSLFDNRYHSFSSKVTNLLERHGHLAPLSSNLLIGIRMEVLPSYRGYGISTLFKQELFRLFSASAQLTALKSFPLQLEVEHKNEAPRDSWSKRMRFSTLEQDDKRATKALNDFYLKQGYLKFGKDLMIKPL